MATQSLRTDVGLAQISFANLPALFRLHAVMAFSYALTLLIVPKWMLGLFASAPLASPGVEIAHLFGAALVLISLIAWGASSLESIEAQKMIARSLLAYTSMGFLILFVSQFSGLWNQLGWVNIATYLILAIGYAYCLTKGRLSEESPV